MEIALRESEQFRKVVETMKVGLLPQTEKSLTMSTSIPVV
jgi:hypothetical protein